MNCSCRLCEVKRDPNFKMKQEFYNATCQQFQPVRGRPNYHSHFDSALEIMSIMEQASPFPSDLNRPILDCLLPGRLCDALFNARRYADGIILAKKIYPVTLNFNYLRYSMEAATQLVRCYLKLRKKKMAQKWFDKIKQLCLVRFGSERWNVGMMKFLID